MINLIVNVNESWGIGKDGNLLCTFAEDFDLFKRLTMNKTIICGRKTLEGFPKGLPLINRTNIVVTNSKDNISQDAKNGCNYYSFMKKLKKRPDSLLTGVRCVDMTVSNKRPGNTKLIVTDQIESVLDIARFVSPTDHDIFVCGGASIYKYFLPYCDTCYVTINDCKDEADTYFPENLLKSKDWRILNEESGTSFDTGIKYRFIEFIKLGV